MINDELYYFSFDSQWSSAAKMTVASFAIAFLVASSGNSYSSSQADVEDPPLPTAVGEDRPRG